MDGKPTTNRRIPTQAARRREAHRLSTIRNVDHVYVFDKGRVVEDGPYQQLRDAGDSRFGRLVAMQAM